MTSEEQIQFLTKLLDITAEMQRIVINYCKLLTEEDAGQSMEDKTDLQKVPF